jgi:hypothetical protein
MSAVALNYAVLCCAGVQFRDPIPFSGLFEVQKTSQVASPPFRLSWGFALHTMCFGCLG